MTDFERGQIFKIMDDRPDAVSFLQFLYECNRYEEMYAWLIRQNLTGKRFMDFVKNACENSNLILASTILTKIEREKTLIPLRRKDLKT